VSRVLVLNATYEALCLVSTKRAIVLMVTEKADLIVSTGNDIRSASLTVAEPSIVRLNSYVSVPRTPRIALSRRAIFARDNYTCQYCGAPAENIDHVIPRSRGGLHVWENVVASCKPCNSRKEDRLLSESNFVLRKAPAPPKGRAWAISLGVVRPEWVPYLGGSVQSQSARIA
jgi:5-methylcytosine-specific restriction endonuclease McrA